MLNHTFLKNCCESQLENHPLVSWGRELEGGTSSAHPHPDPCHLSPDMPWVWPPVTAGTAMGCRTYASFELTAGTACTDMESMQKCSPGAESK